MFRDKNASPFETEVIFLSHQNNRNVAKGNIPRQDISFSKRYLPQNSYPSQFYKQQRISNSQYLSYPPIPKNTTHCTAWNYYPKNM